MDKSWQQARWPAPLAATIRPLAATGADRAAATTPPAAPVAAISLPFCRFCFAATPPPPCPALPARQPRSTRQPRSKDDRDLRTDRRHDLAASRCFHLRGAFSRSGTFVVLLKLRPPSDHPHNFSRFPLTIPAASARIMQQVCRILQLLGRSLTLLGESKCVEALLALLCFLIGMAIVLAVVTVLGHGIWLLAAAVFGAGRRSEPACDQSSRARRPRSCSGQCGKIVSWGRRLLPIVRSRSR